MLWLLFQTIMHKMIHQLCIQFKSLQLSVLQIDYHRKCETINHSIHKNFIFAKFHGKTCYEHKLLWIIVSIYNEEIQYLCKFGLNSIAQSAKSSEVSHSSCNLLSFLNEHYFVLLFLGWHPRYKLLLEFQSWGIFLFHDSIHILPP